MPEFWQRLPVRFFLGNLDFRDTCELIRHRLRIAGLDGTRELFTRPAYEQIYKASEGCPRVVCSIADLALVVGRSLRVRQIDATEVLQACADMDKRSSDSFHYYHFLCSVSDGEKKAAPAAPAPAAEVAPVAPPAEVPPATPEAATVTAPAREVQPVAAAEPAQTVAAELFREIAS
jgi:hypothetical protein